MTAIPPLEHGPVDGTFVAGTGDELRLDAIESVARCPAARPAPACQPPR